MNKLFSKIATLSVGLAMAVGVGVALGKEANQEVRAAAGDNYNLVTSVSNLAAGDEILFGYVGSSKQFANGALSGKFLASVEVSIVDGVLTYNSGSSVQPLTLGKSGSNWTFSYGSTTISATSVKNMASSGGTNTWTIAISSDGVATITNTTTSYGTIYYNESSPRFLNYANALKTIGIYKKAESASPAISLNYDSLNLKTTDSETEITVTPNSVFTETPTITVENVPSCVNATVSGLKVKVSPVAAGNGSFTVKATNGTQVATQTVSVTVTVPAKGETPETALTVAEARAYIDAGTSLSGRDFYVKGKYVKTTTDTSKLSQYKNADIWISDDGADSSTFQAFRCRYLNNADLDSITKLPPVGSNVVVYGNEMELYQSTKYELKNCYLYSITENNDPAITVSSSSISLSSTSTTPVEITVSHSNFSATPTITVESAPSCVTTSVDGLKVSVTAASIGEGTMVIKATNGSEVATANVSIVVTNEHGKSAADPLSITEAIAAIDGSTLEANERYYVTGLFVSLTEAYSSFKNFTVVVTDPADTTKEFTFYRIKADSDPNPETGDLIIASGLGSEIINYNGTYEVSKGNYVSKSKMTIPLTGLTVTSELDTVKVGKTLELTVGYEPSTTTDSKEITWSTSDASIATVDNGTVTGVAVGDVTITATSVAKPSVSGSINLHVSENKVDGEYLISYDTSKNIQYNQSMETTNFGSYTTGFDSEIFTVVGCTGVYANNNPVNNDFSLGGHITTGSLQLTLNETGYVVTKVELIKARAAYATEYPVATVDGISYEPDVKEETLAFYPFSSQFTVSQSVNRFFFESIKITVAVENDANLVNAYKEALLNLTAKGCSSKNVAEKEWARVKTAFDNLNTNYESAATAVKALDESEEMIQRYKVIIEKYGYNEFLGKGYSKSVLVPLFSLNQGGAGYVIVISIVAASAIAFGLFFVLRKKEIK